jgi:cytosine deaminase
MLEYRHQPGKIRLDTVSSYIVETIIIRPKELALLEPAASPEATPITPAERSIFEHMLSIALDEARLGLAEGGIPIGAALFKQDGALVSRGHNQRVQQNDPSIHGETDAFRRAGRQRSYRDLVMVTTLAPCWYCSGLVRQFGFGTLLIGESRNFQGGADWLRELGIRVINMDSQECVDLLTGYIEACPEVWNEDIGELPPSTD